MISRRRTARAPLIPSAQSVHVPAPVGGLNSIEAIGAMNPRDCVLLYNMIPGEYGLRARLGSREWCSGLTGAGDNYVRSILPFTGSTESGSQNRLFATTSSGIWDVTSSGGLTSAYVAGADYAIGDFVTANGLDFVCVDDGATHGSNGLPTLWATLTAYVIGQRVINGDYVYECVLGGFSGATGPTGTGTNIADAGCVWNYYAAADFITDGFAHWTYVASNTAPTLVYSFLDTSGRAGHGTCHVQVTAGGHFLLYWDEANGLHVYTESTGTWVAPTEGAGATQISGVNPANLVGGTVWKGFIAHVEKDTAKVWFSAAGSVYGAVTAINVGFKLKAGGALVCASTWTYDGGAGMDDAFVLASRGGDILIWQGTNPTSADAFALQGVWQVGTLPAGRELMTDLGGELLIITRTGILPLSRLVLGKSVNVEQYETAKIGPIFNAAMLAKAGQLGWSMRLHPEEGALIVTVPNGEGQATGQFAMSLTTKGWGVYRDLPAYCLGAFDGKMYFGTADGSVCINDTYVDGQPLHDSTEYTPVQFSGIGAFNNLQNENQKQVQSIRPYFTGSAPPTFDVGARYDFDMVELATVSEGTHDGDVWDAALWGSAVWGADYSPTFEVRGAAGMGANVAIAWRGAATNRTILAGFGVLFTQGGPS